MKGKELLKTLTEATGLPQEPIDREVAQLIELSGKSKSEVTLDELREIVAEYMQKVLLEAKEHY